MKKKELLEHIRALQQRVALLEAQMAGKQDREIFIPSAWSVPQDIAGCLHEYPFPWHGTTPPPCKKCGQVSTSPYTITCSSTVPDTKELDLDLIGCKGCAEDRKKSGHSLSSEFLASLPTKL